MSQLPWSLFSHVTQWEIISSASVSKAPTTFILEFNGIFFLDVWLNSLILKEGLSHGYFCISHCTIYT